MDEEVALIDGAADRREGRAGDDAGDAESRGQRLADRADIAVGRRIEGRAIFEDDLPAALAPQPVERRERLGHGLGGRRSSGSSARRRRPRPRRGASDAGRPRNCAVMRPPSPRQALGQSVGDVARAGEIVGDDAEQHNAPRPRAAGGPPGREKGSRAR